MYHKKVQGWRKHTDFILWDVVCLHLAFLLGYMTRHGIENPYKDSLYLNIAIIYTMADVLVLIANNTMRDVLKRGFYKEVAKTIKHVILVTFIVSIYLFSAQFGGDYSRITFYLTAVYYILISYGVRLLWKWILKKKQRDTLSTAVYLVTTSDRAEWVIEQFRRAALEDYTLQGLCLLDENRIGQSVKDVPVIAEGNDLLEYLCDKWVDEVFVSVPIVWPYPAKLIDSLTEMGIVVHIQTEQLQTEQWQKQTVQKVADISVRTLSMTLITAQEQFWKRAMDIAGGIVGCIATVFLALIIGPLIYLKSPGPIFFTQIRVGKNGKKFKMYKFRSMYMDAEARKKELMRENRVKDGMMFKLDFDPRIIGCKKLPDGTIKKGIGNFIRDYSLDEFPQFFNVLKGDLSLCGTRPPTVDEWEKYELHHRARLAIKPGITGLWQISGRSNITDFEQVVELDKKYIREWSMGLDFRILLQTVKVVLGKEGSM